MWQRPLTGDVGTERVEPLDHADVAIALELQSGRECQVATTAFARNDDAFWIDVQAIGMRGDPSDARDAIVQPGWKRSYFRRGGRANGVAEVDHRDRDALGRDHATPGFVHTVEAGEELHATAMDVVDARQTLIGVRPNVLDLDGVAVWLGSESLGCDLQALGWRDLFVVAHLRHRFEHRDAGLGVIRLLFG